MSQLLGILGINDNDRVLMQTVGQDVVWDAAQQEIARFNAELDAAMSVFMERGTTNYKERYKLAGGGYLQRRGGQAQSAAVKAAGQWDVAYPLEDFGAAIGGSDVDLAYMTIQDMDRHLDTVMGQSVNTTRREILAALLCNTDFNFVDPLYGTLAVKPLANGDSVAYPPVLGADAEATENHYLASGYASASISDTNNPFPVIAGELEEHFGSPTGGSNIVTFINAAQTAKAESLADFDEVPDRFVAPGANTDVPYNLPANLPGRVLGRCGGCWVVEWRFVPADYIIGVHLDAPRPLVRREDPADTGLGIGLQLVAQDEQHPFRTSFYRHRFGFGVGNRLNGVVMHLTASSYAIPTGYAR